MFEAFKSGLIGLRKEEDPTRWTEGYNFPALEQGRVVKEELPIETPAGMSALVFNTRKPIFADQRVRQALIKLFDFEWVNRTLYHGQYARTESYFDRSELSSFHRRADFRELELLRPFPDAVRPEILDGSFALPESDGSGENRIGREDALQLLEQAGYRLKRRPTCQPDDRRTASPSRFWPSPAARNGCCSPTRRALKQLGIEARDPSGRQRAISASQADLRFRHDTVFLADLAVAGQ